EDGIRDLIVTGVQTCALPICAARIAGAIKGSVTFRKVAHSFAPRSIAASSRWRSKPISLALTVTTAKLMQNITCAIRIVQKPNKIGRASCRERVEITEVDGGI